MFGNSVVLLRVTVEATFYEDEFGLEVVVPAEGLWRNYCSKPASATQVRRPRSRSRSLR